MKLDIKKEMGLKQSKKEASKSKLDKVVDCGEQSVMEIEVEQMKSSKKTTAISKVKDVGPYSIVC